MGKIVVDKNSIAMMHRKAQPAGQCINTLATRISKLPGADWAFNLFGFSDTYGLLTWARSCAGIERAGNCRMKNRQRRSNMTETGRTAPKGAIRGSIRRALADIRINMKGGK